MATRPHGNLRGAQNHVEWSKLPYGSGTEIQWTMGFFAPSVRAKDSMSESSPQALSDGGCQTRNEHMARAERQALITCRPF